MVSTYIIGMDCGASHTRVVVWKMGEKVYEAEDWPGLNMDLIEQGIDLEGIYKKLRELGKFTDGTWVVAMAGLDSQDEVEEAVMWWRRVLTANEVKVKKLLVISDIELVLWAGSIDGSGIALIAGTGSNCLARGKDKRMIKVGGMSHLLSDEGSGFALGWRCLRLVTKMSDGRLPKTKLVKDMFDLYHVGNIVGLKNLLVKTTDMKAAVAKSAVVLLEAAERGESEAEEAVRAEITELVEMVAVVNKSFSSSKEMPVYLAGSLFKNDYYLEKFKEKLSSLYPEQAVKKVTPIDGILNLVERS